MPHLGAIGGQLGDIGGGGGGGSISLTIVSDTLDSGGEKSITGFTTTGKIVIPILYSDPSYSGALRVVSTTSNSALIRSDAGFRHAGFAFKTLIIGS